MTFNGHSGASHVLNKNRDCGWYSSLCSRLLNSLYRNPTLFRVHFIVYSIFLYTGYSILIEITANEYLNYIILIPITTFYIYLRTHIIDIVILGNILYIGIVSVYKLLTL